MINYDRNRKRINKLAELGLRQHSAGFIKDGYWVTNDNISYLSEEAWDILIMELKKSVGPKSDQELFDAYIKQLNDIKPPRLKDERLDEMVKIIDNVITEYTKYVQEELSEPIKD